MTPTESQFWPAVEENDLATARLLLEADGSLAGRDFRPEAERDPHTEGFPLVKACEQGHFEMAKLLLEFGADVDAKSPVPEAEQRELGLPIQHAVWRRDWRLANLLLDRGASVHAYPWCDKPLVSRVYELARAAGAPAEMARRGFASYLGDVEPVAVPADAPEEIRFFDRLLSAGAQINLFALVREEYRELIEELLQRCPEAPAPRQDAEDGSVFEKICDGASWHGYPKILARAVELCPHLHNPDRAKISIHRAVVSHNRDGSADDYAELIEGQLRYLEQHNELEKVITTRSLLPHVLLAENYCWPRNYGHKAPGVDAGRTVAAR